MAPEMLCHTLKIAPGMMDREGCEVDIGEAAGESWVLHTHLNIFSGSRMMFDSLPGRSPSFGRLTARLFQNYKITKIIP